PPASKATTARRTARSCPTMTALILLKSACVLLLRAADSADRSRVPPGFIAHPHLGVFSSLYARRFNDLICGIFAVDRLGQVSSTPAAPLGQIEPEDASIMLSPAVPVVLPALVLPCYVSVWEKSCMQVAYFGAG